MRGVIGGLMVGALVAGVGLGILSMVTEQPAGNVQPEAPLVEAPQANDTQREPEPEGSSSPVGAVMVDIPQTPDLPDGNPEGISTPPEIAPETAAPRADTDPPQEPNVLGIEGSLTPPDTGEGAAIRVDPVDPVLPDPQGRAPQTPQNEANLTVSTAPAPPTVVVEPDPQVVTPQEADSATGDDSPNNALASPSESFVVDLGGASADAESEQDPVAATTQPTSPGDGAPEDFSDDQIADADATSDPAGADDSVAQRLQLQGGENTLLADRDTGVTIRRPAAQTPDTPAGSPDPAPAFNALDLYAAKTPDITPSTEDTPLMSIVLIDDGRMSAAAAALSGLPFAVTIALDPGLPGAADLMTAYRARGFEVVALAKLPEGAVPSDVEITFESVFATLPESIALLDLGEGGLQSDRAVTAQAMEFLAAQGRGFVTASTGLNMAGRAAGQAGVPAATVFRDLDSEGQDARIVRRFVDQAAFRARQDGGVVLVGRVRPDTISALILWGTANVNLQVALVPLSTVLLAQ